MDDHANDSILARLRESGIDAPRRRLRDATSEETPLLREVELHEIGRYEILGRIAEGGVGEVAKGRDVDLGRDVALKTLKEEHLDNPDLLRRFVEEAQIGGQLQHPGIVPVYEMGLQSDGRPFFAMKLVKGQTLTALLSARQNPEDNLRRTLSIFEQICRTMAYAHARGVIHRDLKPSNVMVGAFGEVQILDWGFAKVLAQGGVADERRAKEMKRDVTVISTLRSESVGSQSIPGSVMGTPAYMPPEQALGHVDSLDERSDVFSLGAILTEILTGEPAYTGEGLEKLVKAAEADLEDANARLDACGQDPELVKLARSCLAPLRPDRPAHAGMVARAVTGYLTGVEERAQKSELRAAKARARAEAARQAAAQQKRSRRQTLALAAAVLLLITIAAGGYAFLERDRQNHLTGTVEEVREGMRQATLLRGRDGPAAALSMAMRARDLAKTGEVPADLLEKTGVLVVDLQADVSKLLAAAAQQTVDEAMQRTIESIRIDRGPGLGHVGYDNALLSAFLDYGIDVDGTDVDGAIEKLRTSAIRLSLALVLDEWALMRRTKEALADRNAERLLALSRAVDDDPWRNRVRECIGQANFEGLHRLAEDLDPSVQPAESIDFLARLLMNPGDYVRAEALLSRAVKEYRGDYWLNLHLSECLYELRWRDNRRTRENAVRFAGAALAIAPKSPWAWYQLATAKLGAREDPAEMEYAVRRALELQPDYAAAHSHLAAFVLKPRGQIDEAISHYREAIRILPSNPDIYSNMVLALCADNRAHEALREAERALQRFPKNAGLLDVKAYCIETLEGSEAAREAWEEAVEALEEELRENSENLVAWERLKSIYSVALKDRKRIQRPIRKLVELMPKNPWLRWNLAYLHYERGEFEEALEELEQALSDAPPDKRRVTILKTRAGILLTLRRYEESTATQRRVIEWVNEDPYAHWNLGISFCYGGRLAEGVSEFARAQELGLQLLPHLIEYRAMMERMLALEPDLDRILKGEREPADTAELELFADFLMLKREDLAAARLYRRLFPQSPASRSGCRYDAAATAAVGGDEELSPLDAAQRAEWRHWALELLEEELSARKPVLTDPVGRARTRGEVVAWFYDPRWSGYRTEPALLRLPKEEREAWRNLWADIRDAIE